ncbi:Exocyst complex component [Trichinella pseudospiralis]
MGGVVCCWHHACLAEIAVKNPGQCFTLPSTAASWLDSVVSLEPRKSYVKDELQAIELCNSFQMLKHLYNLSGDFVELMNYELTSDGQVSLENDFTVSAANWTLVATARLYIAIR